MPLTVQKPPHTPLLFLFPLTGLTVCVLIQSDRTAEPKEECVCCCLCVCVHHCKCVNVWLGISQGYESPLSLPVCCSSVLIGGLHPYRQHTCRGKKTPTWGSGFLLRFGCVFSLKCPGMNHKEPHLKLPQGGKNIKEKATGSLYNKAG